MGIDGQPLAHVKDAGHSCRGSWFDLALQGRVYCLVDSSTSQNTGPSPVQLIAYDLTRGAQAGQLVLTEALSGWWQDGQSADGEPLTQFLEPGVALSPDGHRLAIAHAEADKVTLMDAQKLTVERTVSLSRRTGLLDWFTPSVAYAKNAGGIIRQAVFSPDGQYLYVFTQEVGEVPAERRGLWLVDLGRGAIIAEALPEMQVRWVRPAPDGSVYVFGTTDQRLEPYEIRPSSPSSLWRLDALTLQPLAKREFTGYRGSRLVLEPPSR
jgi:hypothetical protein